MDDATVDRYIYDTATGRFPKSKRNTGLCIGGPHAGKMKTSERTDFQVSEHQLPIGPPGRPVKAEDTLTTHIYRYEAHWLYTNNAWVGAWLHGSVRDVHHATQIVLDDYGRKQ